MFSHEEAHDIEVAVARGGVRGRAPRLRVLRVDVRLRAEEQADDLQGAAAGGGGVGGLLRVDAALAALSE